MGVSVPSAPPAALARPPFYARLHNQVLFAIVLGILVGWLWPQFGAGLKPLGDAFVNLVKMVIAPVIFLTIVTGIAALSDLKALGRIAAKAFGYFLVFSTLALVVGLVVANLVHPGTALQIDPATLDPAKVAEYATKAHERTLVGFLLAMVPTTLVSALTGDNILQVLLVSILTGVSITLVGEPARPVLTLFESASAIVFRIVSLLMRLAPIGTFGAMAFTVGQYGLAVLMSLAGLVLTFFATAAFFIVVILGLVARANGFSIFKLLRYLRAELLLVLGTSSSETALPNLMLKLEEAGCAPTVVGVVVPTGYSFNLDGTNIYMTLAALFIAQALGIELSISQQIILLLVAMLSSKGAAGVTGAGFITLAATLSAVPVVPVAGMALILGVDRFMSQGRSLTNFIGNAVATIVIARWEGALDTAALDRALNRPEALEDVVLDGVPD